MATTTSTTSDGTSNGGGGAPPAPPAPPPSLLAPGTLLAGGRRPPAHSDDIGRVRAAQASRPVRRPAFAGVDSATLQHAAASLRKTEHGESLLTRDSQPLLGGADQLAGGRHWEDCALDARLGQHQAGTPLYAAHADAEPHAALHHGGHRDGLPLMMDVPSLAGEAMRPDCLQPNGTNGYSSYHQQTYSTTHTYTPENAANTTAPIYNYPEISSNPIMQASNLPISYSNNSCNTPASLHTTPSLHDSHSQQCTSSTDYVNVGPRHHPTHSIPEQPPSIGSTVIHLSSASEPQRFSTTSSQYQYQQQQQQQRNSSLLASRQDHVGGGGMGRSNGYSQVTQATADFPHYSSHAAPYKQQQPANGGVEECRTEGSNSEMAATMKTTMSGSSHLITDPKAYIHHFATQTPASVLSAPHAERNGTATTTTTTTTTIHRTELEKSTSAHQPNGNGSAPTSRIEKRAHDFVKELRDAGLTERQKYSNQFQQSAIQEREPPTNAQLQNVFEETKKQFTSSYAAPFLPRSHYQAQSTLQHLHPATSTTTNHLIEEMEWKLRTDVDDFCSKCGKKIVGDTPGVTALGSAYHVHCFTCDECRKQLAGCSFYNVDGRNLCQVDYMASLEKCEKCTTPITQKILRAMGKPYHPECFVCPACTKSLDGVPFTLDKEGHAYCLDCYHERFSPRCAICLKAIAPAGNETEVARVIAMDRSYHIDCYRCEDCGLKLNSKVEGQGCYPLESHLFCKNCNLNRLKSVR